MSGFRPSLPSDLILPALRDVYGEQAWWLRPDPRPSQPIYPGKPGLVPIKGRFRIDPFDAQLDFSLAPGVNSVQTWFYCDRRDVPTTDRSPGLHDLLLIRNEWWEIVHIDADDIGELGYRMLKASDRDADPATPIYPFPDQASR